MRPARFILACVLMCSVSAAQAPRRFPYPPPTQPADGRAASEPRPLDAPAAQPSDAEKIARLQRSIDDDTRQLEALKASLNDPASEFRSAETAFAELDRQLTERRKQRDSTPDDKPELRAAHDRDVAELEPRHTLARERFDLAIRERRTLQEQIATLQQKVLQDGEALKKLKGDAVTSQPADAAAAKPPESGGAPAGLAPSAAAPAGAAAAPIAGQAPSPGQPPAANPSAQPSAPAVTPPLINLAPPPVKEPAPELVEARQEAAVKKAEAQSAKADAASLTDRIAALRKNTQLEQELYDTSRKKLENAQSTERSLYESLQKKWQDGSPVGELHGLQREISEARARLGEVQVESRDRSDRLDRYQAELYDLQSQHISAMEQAQRTQSEAAKAQKQVERLENPLAPSNLWRWLLERGPRVAAIVVGMFVLLMVSRLAQKRILAGLARRAVTGTFEDRENRARTLVSVFHSTMRVVVYFGGGLMLLTEAGVNIVPLMGGAAVLGLAAAFGAQNLIRDYFSGFMILLESQYSVNDVVRIGDISGQVERITLRLTVLRGEDGTVHFIPNGEIKRISNMTFEWSRAIFEISIAYKEDVDKVMNVLIELARDLRRDPDYRGLILEVPEMLGIDSFAQSAIVIKFTVKTRPLQQWRVKRELLRRIKNKFDEMGIEIPVPQIMVVGRLPAGAEPVQAGPHAPPASPDVH